MSDKWCIVVAVDEFAQQKGTPDKPGVPVLSALAQVWHALGHEAFLYLADNTGITEYSWDTANRAIGRGATRIPAAQAARFRFNESRNVPVLLVDLNRQNTPLHGGLLPWIARSRKPAGASQDLPITDFAQIVIACLSGEEHPQLVVARAAKSDHKTPQAHAKAVWDNTMTLLGHPSETKSHS